MSAPVKCEQCGQSATYAIQIPCVHGCGGLMYYDCTENERLAARVRELEAALIQQAKLTGYYNGKGNGLAYPSPNYPGKEAWWDYLTEEARAVLASPQRPA